MKKIFTAALLILLTNFSFPQWEHISPLPNGIEMNSMQFINNNGWVVCSDGLMN